MDEHMVGTGIYPKNVPAGSLLLKTVVRCGVPWDVYMQYELTPHCHATQSIQHIWNVKNCRRENGQILCDPGSDLSRPVPIREDALVVHGVKDGSLIDLLGEAPCGASEEIHPADGRASCNLTPLVPAQTTSPVLPRAAEPAPLSQDTDASPSVAKPAKRAKPGRHIKRHSAAYMAARKS